jgi:hypothetical protein
MAFNPHTAALALHRFVIIPQLLRNNALESLTKSVVQDVKAGRMNSGDAMVSSAFTAYAHPLSEHLLLDLQPLIGKCLIFPCSGRANIVQCLS